MPKKQGTASMGRWVMIARTIYDLYGVVVYAAIELDGWIQKRRAKKERGEKEPEEKAETRKEHPQNTRLRRMIEKDLKERKQEENLRKKWEREDHDNERQ